MPTLKDFLYLDTDLLNSLFSQHYQGLIKDVQTGTSDKGTIKSSIGVDLKIVKGSAGTDSTAENTRSEKLELHHYAYEILESELEAEGLLGKDRPILKLDGNLRIIDSDKVTTGFTGLKSLIDGFEATQKLSTKKAESVPQNIKNISGKAKDIGKMIGQLANNGIFAYLGSAKVELNRKHVVNYGAPEFTNNGRLFEGTYVLVGLQLKEAPNSTDTNSDDILVTLSSAFAAFQDLMKTDPIKPVAIYRIIDQPRI